jgi:hypothetical protein
VSGKKIGYATAVASLPNRHRQLRAAVSFGLPRYSTMLGRPEVDLPTRAIVTSLRWPLEHFPKHLLSSTLYISNCACSRSLPNSASAEDRNLGREH